LANIQTNFLPRDPRIAYDHTAVGDIVIFFHGIGGNRVNRWDQLAAFADRLHGVAWNIRGYGLPDDYLGPLDFGDSIKDILLFLEHLGVPTAHIVGLSMGGLITFGFTARSPDGVKMLTLSGTRASFAQKVPEEIEKFVHLCKKP
jgi:pimeloyl-ACP methyl ester carboxylesterase